MSNKPNYLSKYQSKKGSRSAEIKAGLPYPVIDTDLHTTDFKPLLEEYVDKFGGAKAVDGFRALVGEAKQGPQNTRGSGAGNWYTQTEEERRARRTVRPPWWNRPARNTLDLATVALPDLLYQRLEEQGTDFAILYPNLSTFIALIGNEDLRRPLVRAVNAYHADVFAPYADRLTPVAAIPLITPQEGIEELEFAVNTLKLKAAIIPGYVRRPVKAIADKIDLSSAPELARFATWIDNYGIDSAYDYDPFWKRAIELKVPLTTHSSGQGWSSRSSPSNFMYNHIGHFADAAHALAKSLFFGGVTHRFPGLRLGMLEGGGNWGAQLFADIVGHWDKRNRNDIGNYDPEAVDKELLAKYFREHGKLLTRGRNYSNEELAVAALETSADLLAQTQGQNKSRDDFALAHVDSVEDIRDRFVPNFYFGSEADDPTVAAAFNTKVNPLGIRFNAFWASDSGHWDVPDLTKVLAESWELVEKGVLTEADFKDLVYTNPHRFYSEANPEFFKGTAVEEKILQKKAAA